MSPPRIVLSIEAGVVQTMVVMITAEIQGVMVVGGMKEDPQDLVDMDKAGSKSLLIILCACLNNS